MKTSEEKKELKRAEQRAVWFNVWAQTANANDCKAPKTATAYADAALSAWNSRFESHFD